jgi:hypothetical protein
VSLIQARGLDESFLQHLPPDFHEYFRDCLQESRNKARVGNIPADTE